MPKKRAVERRAVRRDRSGRCRYCGCTDVHGCTMGCSWADHNHTLCSLCVDVDVDFHEASRENKTNRAPSHFYQFRTAFFRGWTVGVGDVERQVDSPSNPFQSPGPSRWWNFGLAAGRERIRLIEAAKARRMIGRRRRAS